ncbi:hypothetical protein NA78x_004648 [Anatilimnocola sp. NA78]|uniref:hypothetical protein n=1 Tax=Anatilimnocola sp. NA78 TaxID=3415683 RepID=UPI003CE4A9D9
MPASFSQADSQPAPTIQTYSRGGSPSRNGLHGDFVRSDHFGSNRGDRRGDDVRQIGYLGGDLPAASSTPSFDSSIYSPPVYHPPIVVVIVPPTPHSTSFTPPASNGSSSVRDSLQSLVSSNLGENPAENNRGSSAGSLRTSSSDSSAVRLTSNSLSPLASLSLLSSDLQLAADKAAPSLSGESLLASNSDENAATRLEDEQPASNPQTVLSADKQFRPDSDDEETLIQLDQYDPLARGKRKLITPKGRTLLTDRAELDSNSLRPQHRPGQLEAATREQIWLAAADQLTATPVINDELIELIAAEPTPTPQAAITGTSTPFKQFAPASSLEASLGYYQAGEIEGENSPAVVTPAAVAAAASLPVVEPK